jgi:hypothetical protein
LSSPLISLELAALQSVAVAQAEQVDALKDTVSKQTKVIEKQVKTIKMQAATVERQENGAVSWQAVLSVGVSVRGVG